MSLKPLDQPALLSHCPAPPVITNLRYHGSMQRTENTEPNKAYALCSLFPSPREYVLHPKGDLRVDTGRASVTAEIEI